MENIRAKLILLERARLGANSIAFTYHYGNPSHIEQKRVESSPDLLHLCVCVSQKVCVCVYTCIYVNQLVCEKSRLPILISSRVISDAIVSNSSGIFLPYLLSLTCSFLLSASLIFFFLFTVVNFLNDSSPPWINRNLLT